MSGSRLTASCRSVFQLSLSSVKETLTSRRRFILFVQADMSFYTAFFRSLRHPIVAQACPGPRSALPGRRTIRGSTTSPWLRIRLNTGPWSRIYMTGWRTCFALAYTRPFRNLSSAMIPVPILAVLMREWTPILPSKHRHSALVDSVTPQTSDPLIVKLPQQVNSRSFITRLRLSLLPEVLPNGEVTARAWY